MSIKSFGGDHRFLSNFWRAEVTYDGIGENNLGKILMDIRSTLHEN